MKTLWAMLKNAFTGFSEHNVLRLSAALAYYAMFSIGPLLILAVGIAGLVFGNQTVRGQISDQLQSTFGPSSAKTIESMMAAQKHGSSVVATIIGIGALLFGAAGVFGGLQDALNSIWSVKAKPHAGVMGLIRSRFLSLAMVLGTGFLLLVSMALSTFLAAVTDSLGSHLFSAIIVQALNFVVSFAVTTVLFAMIFKYLPDVNIPFRDVWVGATGTALLFSIGKYFLALYLGRASTTSVYGAAGSVIVVLLWVYYASVILFFGAEFTRAFAVARGTRIGVRNYAMPASREMSPGAAVPADSPKGDKREITSPGGGAVGLPSPAFASFETSPSAHRFSTSAPLVSLRPAKFVWFLIAAGFASGLAMIPKSSRRRSKRA